MKRKHYEEPSLEVVVLNHDAQLLAGSVQTQDYTLHEYVEE
jgi:hypothetical protein